jgi:hypothetical protein
MSRTRNYLARTLAATGLLLAAWLEAGQAQSVTPERALLNRTTAAADFAGELSGPGYVIQAGNNQITGEKALLGQTDPIPAWALQLGTAADVVMIDTVSISGERALLGRWPASRMRRPADWAMIR